MDSKPMGREFEFGYVNHRGEYSNRKVLPQFIWFGTTEYHKEEQWFMRALDLDKQAMRDFAMNDLAILRPD